MLVSLSTLRRGARFTCPWSGEQGKLVSVNASRARVQVGSSRRQFTTASGKTVSITRPRVTDWAPETMVEVKRGGR